MKGDILVGRGHRSDGEIVETPPLTLTGNALEFYETPEPLTRFLFSTVAIHGRIYECCVGDAAILRAVQDHPGDGPRRWVTNDLDDRWRADYHLDATTPAAFDAAEVNGPIDWTVTNPAFSTWLDVAELAIARSRLGVALYLRASAHEVLKTGRRRSWFGEHRPTGILWNPRFAHQRSKTSGKWSTDSMTTCWVVWERGIDTQLIEYASPAIIDELDAYTPAFRARMDRLMGVGR